MLDALLAPHFPVAPVPATADLGSFLDHVTTTWPSASPAERALWGGAAADRLGFAFVIGVQAALTHLLGEAGSRPAFCVTETGRPHPRHIETRYAEGRVTGTKGHVTGGPLADVLWVVASVGWEGEVHRLVLVPVASDAPGVRLEPRPALPFAPEVPHARVHFDQTPAMGPARPDAWATYTVPFRTLEDLYVQLAATAYLVRAARRGGTDDTVIEDLLGLASGFESLTRADPTSPTTHRALAGLGAWAGARFDDLSLTDEEAARFARDRPLLDIAAAARAARLERARLRTTH